MTQHHVDFIFNEPGVGGIDLDIDPKLLLAQKEDAAREEIDYVHPTLSDVEITKIVEVA